MEQPRLKDDSNSGGGSGGSSSGGTTVITGSSSSGGGGGAPVVWVLRRQRLRHPGGYLVHQVVWLTRMQQAREAAHLAVAGLREAAARTAASAERRQAGGGWPCHPPSPQPAHASAGLLDTRP